MDQQIPYIVHESTIATMERVNRRLWIVVIILILALVGTNAGWIYYESQWSVVEESTTMQEIAQDSGDGGSNNLHFVGGDYYGNTESEGN